MNATPLTVIGGSFRNLRSICHGLKYACDFVIFLKLFFVTFSCVLNLFNFYSTHIMCV